MHDDFFGVLATCPCVFDGRLLRPADIAALAAAAQQQWPLLEAQVIRCQIATFLCVYAIGCTWRVLPDGQRPHLVATLAALAARQAHQTPPGRLTNTPPDRVGADRPRPCSRNDPAVPSVQDVQRSLAFV